MIPRIDNELLALCIQRAGWRRGAQVAEFVMEWTICAEDVGHDPGIEEFADWWRDGSRRTAYRRMDAFRAAFPEATTPSDIARAQKRQKAPHGAKGQLA
jgi:hypothetical protein